MAQINVFLVHPTDDSRREASLPEDVPLRRLLPAIINRLSLPSTDPSGGQVSYRMHHKASGQTLDDDETLAEAGVVAGDELRLRAEWIGGDCVEW